MALLSLEHISKSYGQQMAVDDVELSIPEQSIFGLLGPNGAGKTSLIRIIMQIIAPDRGRIDFQGSPLQSSDIYQMGYMPEERGLYSKMKVYSHLLYLAQLKGVSKQEAHQKLPIWLEKFDLTDWQYRKVNELSKGMQQKVQFISTVVHEPELLIFDEPFSGLDPVNVNLIKREIQRLREEGATIILSTHRMERVEEVCENIALIHQGRKMVDGSVATIKQQYKKNNFRVRYTGQLSNNLSQTSAFQLQSTHDQESVFHVQEQASSNELLKALLQEDIEIKEFQELLPTLDDVFIETVQQKISDV